MLVRTTRLPLSSGLTEELSTGIKGKDMSIKVKPRYAFVDDRLYAKEFRTNDCVRKTGLRDFVLTPYAGRVLYSNPDTGVVVVQWPWGAENNTPTELVHDKSGDWGLPMLDQSYKTWESERYSGTEVSSQADSRWRKSLAATVHNDYLRSVKPLYVACSRLVYDSISETQAPHYLSNYRSRYGSTVINEVVKDVYSEAKRIAIKYTKSTNKYSVTAEEMEAGLSCPRCSTSMGGQGQIKKVMIQCPACGFTALMQTLQYPA